MERIPLRGYINQWYGAKNQSRWRCRIWPVVEAVQWNLPMAGAIMAALSTLIVYLILGRYFILGLLAGSVKG